MLLEYSSNKKIIIFDYPETYDSEKIKLTTCDIKCETRGILIMATNCSIVVSYRKMYGSESLGQVGLFYLDTYDYWHGKT